jgi:hypothetical protein
MYTRSLAAIAFAIVFSGAVSSATADEAKPSIKNWLKFAQNTTAACLGQCDTYYKRCGQSASCLDYYRACVRGCT